MNLTHSAARSSGLSGVVAVSGHGTASSLGMFLYYQGCGTLPAFDVKTAHVTDSRFTSSRWRTFPGWLEYFPIKHAQVTGLRFKQVCGDLRP